MLPAFVNAAGGNHAQSGLIYWCGALGAAGALIRAAMAATSRSSTGAVSAAP